MSELLRGPYRRSEDDEASSFGRRHLVLPERTVARAYHELKEFMRVTLDDLINEPGKQRLARDLWRINATIERRRRGLPIPQVRFRQPRPPPDLARPERSRD